MGILIRTWGCAALAVLAFGPGSAVAAPGTLTHLQTNAGDVGMAGARGVVVSPDGKNLYVAASTARTVVTYARAVDGSLTYSGCIRDPGAPALCTQEAEGLSAPQYVAISPDGKSVYAAGGGADSAVVALSRDAGTGALSPVGCWRDAESAANCAGNNAPALAGAEGVTVSPDGKNVYVVAQGDSAISSFTRDPGTGALTYVSCISNGAVGCGSTTTGGAFLYPREVTSAPDGRGVYAAAANSGVVAFLRNPADGVLTYAQTSPGLAPALIVGVAVSPDDGYVYAGSVNRSAVYMFRRDPLTALVTEIGCVKDAIVNPPVVCPTASGLQGSEGVVVAPDGASLYSTAFSGSALAAFDRSRTTGLLTATGCFRDLPGVPAGCATQVNGLGNSRAVTTSPDGRNVYATGQFDGAVVAFGRELPPPDPAAPPPAPPAAPAAPAAAPVTPTAAVKPAAVKFSSITTLPSAKRCVSRRSFRIRLRQPKGAKLSSAAVKVNGKTVASRKGARVTAPIDLRGLPKGKVTVSITVKLADKRTVRGSRTYRTCATKRR